MFQNCNWSWNWVLHTRLFIYWTKYCIKYSPYPLRIQQSIRTVVEIITNGASTVFTKHQTTYYSHWNTLGSHHHCIIWKSILLLNHYHLSHHHWSLVDLSWDNSPHDTPHKHWSIVNHIFYKYTFYCHSLACNYTLLLLREIVEQVVCLSLWDEGCHHILPNPI